MQSLWIAYYDGEAMPGAPGSGEPKLVLEVLARGLRYGRNGLLLTAESGDVTAWFSGERSGQLQPAAPFAVGMLSGATRKAVHSLGHILSTATSGLWHPGLRPFLCGIHVGGGFRLYAIAEETATEVSALRYAELPAVFEATAPGFLQAVAAAAPQLQARLPQLNTGRCYAQWRQDFEMERKYTYRTIPDIWPLAVELYRHLAEARYAGFFPEPHMGFQVFDYDNYIFDVVGPPAEAGYISFIPQVDGRVTVKRKWFRENAEIRRESLWPNQSIASDTYFQAAQHRVAGDVVELPPFRRKRFDINYESLETGNIYGVYFDICRTMSTDVDHCFGQVEVEYCRSRTLLPLEDIMPEYERLCASTKSFLDRHGVACKQDLYSKLDFSRAAYDLAVAS